MDEELSDSTSASGVTWRGPVQATDCPKPDDAPAWGIHPSTTKHTAHVRGLPVPVPLCPCERTQFQSKHAASIRNASLASERHNLEGRPRRTVRSRRYSPRPRLNVHQCCQQITDGFVTTLHTPTAEVRLIRSGNSMITNSAAARHVKCGSPSPNPLLVCPGRLS